ncbi:TPA: hypothetical protein ACH3X1_013589, partial [Trebouxia sp. C0004]
MEEKRPGSTRKWSRREATVFVRALKPRRDAVTHVCHPGVREAAHHCIEVNRLTVSLCHWSHTCGELLFIQVCSDPTPVHCSTVQGKMQSPLIITALQDRLASGLYH